MADRRSFKGDQLFAVRRSREVDLIGIKADLAMPDVAHRHADPQLATACLSASGVEHADASDPAVAGRLRT